MPEGTNSHDPLKAIEQKVAFVPGDCFYPDEGNGIRNFRLNFSNTKPQQIEEGIRRLSIAVRAQLEKNEPVAAIV
jgi:2-aminoadipate transaminase